MEFQNWRGPSDVPPISEVGLPAFLGKILASRGYGAELLKEDVPLSDPYLLKDMDRAVKRIREALAQEERILVFGDYDCDGITATVMLYDYLENCGADVLYYIPEREREGYGLNLEALDRVKSAGVSLIITVDNGIVSLEEAAHAKELGVDLIITDHHMPRERLPEACAVVDPHRTDDPYPFKDLCGAAVAFQLLCALEEGERDMVLEQYGDLLVIGVLADAVPLVGENRTLAKMGLEALAGTQRAGLLALASVASLDLERRDSDLVTYGIAPRINAAGRIGSVDTAVELLLCDDEERAQELAEEMDRLNAQRKTMEGEILSEIRKQIDEHPEILRRRVLVFVG